MKNMRLANGVLSLAVLASTASCGEGEWSAVPRPVRVERGLPNWATEEERKLQALAPPPEFDGGKAAPPAGFRVPAEYEPMQAVVMAWTDYETMLQAIAQYTAQAGAEVWMIGGPSSISGVPSDKYRRLNLAFDSVWTRDYGPVGIYEPTGALGIVDPTYRHYATRPNDDRIPCAVAQQAGAACYGTSLILDGGNYMTDGRGNVFVSERIYEWNTSLTRAQVNGLLLDYFGAHTLHVFAYAKDAWGEPADGTGHIDMFVKLLPDCKVAVAETAESPFASVLEAAASYFATLECQPGRTYQVFRVAGWTRSGVWYTYTNALFVNGTLILPSYSSGDNAAARAVFQSALPAGYSVVSVSSDSSIRAGGAIHCVTEQIPAEQTGECQAASDCHLPHVASYQCVNGQCLIAACELAFADCDADRLDGCETPLGTTSDCASCGDACHFTNAAAACQGGACVMGACAAGFGDCNASATDGCERPLGTVNDCASCGDACHFTNAAAVCQGGVCAMGACAAGFGDCNGNASDGCETPLGTASDCAGCGNVCSFANAAATCQGNACVMGACAAGFGDCDGSASDGCETALSTTNNCGACGRACAPGQACNATSGGFACGQPCPDNDGDGHPGNGCGGDDCDDGAPFIHPGAPEVCDGADDDCDGLTDEDDVCRTRDGDAGGCGCGGAPGSGVVAALLVMLAGRVRRR